MSRVPGRDVGSLIGAHAGQWERPSECGVLCLASGRGALRGDKINN